jgi:hypothetical protein
VWLSYSCSAYYGSGTVSGELDAGSGEVSGDFFVGFGSGERLQIILAATMIAIGTLMKVSRMSQHNMTGGGTWYPNRRQWWVIWIAYAATAFVAFAAPHDSDDDGPLLIAFIVIGAVLLVWRFSNRPS